MKSLFKTCSLALLATAVLPLAGTAVAQNYPTKAVTVVVPYSPGGTADITARVVSQKLSERLGQTFVIENRAGASGMIGTAAVAKAPADGHTLLLGTAGIFTTNPSLFSKLPYDAQKDFVPISMINTAPNIVVVHPSLPVKNLTELAAYAKANPGKLSFASSGNGTTGHLTGELFKKLTGANMVHVAYKGSAPAVADVLAGHVQVLFDQIPPSMPHIQAGKLRALAVTTPTRVSVLPDVPTTAEAGVNNYLSATWFGFFAPANTPKPVVAKLHREIVEVLKQPDVRAKLSQAGVEVVGNAPEEFAKVVEADYAKWGDVIKSIGLKLD